MVPAAWEEGVVQVGQMRYNAFLLRDSQHAEVPFPQVVAAGCLLLCRVAVQDVVIALHTQSCSVLDPMGCQIEFSTAIQLCRGAPVENDACRCCSKNNQLGLPSKGTKKPAGDAKWASMSRG